MSSSPVIMAAPLVLNVETRNVWFGDRSVRLTGLQTELLLRLMQEPGTVVTHRTLGAAVWEGGGTAAKLAELVQNLRHRLVEIGAGRCVQSISGRGYWFLPDRAYEPIAHDIRKLIETHHDAALADRVRAVMFGGA